MPAPPVTFRSRLLRWLLLAGLALAWLAPNTSAASPENTAPAILSLSLARTALAEGHPETIYLAWSTLTRGAHPAGDRPVTTVLVAASRQALGQKDAALAMGLAEAALRLAPKAPAPTLALSAAAQAMALRGAAATALDEALARRPRHGELLFQRAQLFEAEGERARAIAHYRRIPRKHPRHPEAKIILARISRPPQKQAASGSAVASASPPRTGSIGTTSYGSPVSIRHRQAGMAASRSDHFEIIYLTGSKDFGARARYEAKVLGMFEDAHRRLVRLLAFTPERVFEVVLYTREAFALHFGGSATAGVLGFYQGKIRMNHSENLSEAYFSTVVHELTHAFLDSLCDDAGGQLATWFNEGFAEWAEWEITKDGDRGVRSARALRRMRKLAREIPLARMRQGSISALGRFTTAGYLKARAAVSVLIGTGTGMRRFQQICNDVRAGRDFDLALRDAYGASMVDGLEEDANKVLSR